MTIQLELSFGTTNEPDGRLGSYHDISPPRHFFLFLMSAHFWKLPNMRGAFLSFALKKTTLLFSSCFLPGSTATSGLDNLELVRVSEVYFLLMYVPPEYFPRASRTELVKRAVGGDVAICSALQVTSGGGTADQGDRGHLGKGRDIHRQNPILGMGWTWAKKKIPECKRSENSASTISRYSFPVSYGLVDERVGLHHISCIRRIFTPVTISPVVRCTYKRDVKSCLVSPIVSFLHAFLAWYDYWSSWYPRPCSEIQGISSGVQHTE
ncbi:hypothetical protein BKA82DRAFT_2400922 [Pisolithus tinctorius]|nr:hypothetical protein BKA82DRAFT_2400922 [Pisolithus tinctorius]